MDVPTPLKRCDSGQIYENWSYTNNTDRQTKRPTNIDGQRETRGKVKKKDVIHRNDFTKKKATKNMTDIFPKCKCATKAG